MGHKQERFSVLVQCGFPDYCQPDLGFVPSCLLLVSSTATLFADSNGLIQNSLLVLSMLYSAQVYDTQGIDYLVYSYQRTFLIWSGRGFSQFLFNLHVGMYLPTDMHSEWNHFGFSIRSV